MTLWSAIHAERTALANDLETLDSLQWHLPSLSDSWTVEEVLAHLTAAASIGRMRWLAGIVGARFNPAVHNQRRLVQHLGRSPEETLERFRRITTSTTAASGHTPAWLGEVVVHAQDIRRPLGIDIRPPIEVVTAVADFYASRDFTVASHSAIKGLRLEATGGPFAAGVGPRVTGTTLALTMAMAGRASFCAELDGEGVETLHGRCATT